MIKKTAQKYSDELYAIFRILVGLMFIQHGVQKLFGMLGGQQVELVSLMGLVGIIEFVGGIMIAIGFLPRIAAFVASIEMVVALVKVHFPQGWAPITNGGEKAVLFLAAFLIIMIYGTRKCGCDLLMSSSKNSNTASRTKKSPQK